MVSNLSVSFNKIYIIEFLGDSDPKTGKKLYEDICDLRNILLDDLHVDFVSINYDDGLLSYINKIYISTIEINAIFVIHIESHGGLDSIGPSHDKYLSFDRITPLLRKINI